MAFVHAVGGSTLVHLHSVDNFFKGVTSINCINNLSSPSDQRHLSLLSSDIHLGSVSSGRLCEAVMMTTKSGKAVIGSPDLQILTYSRERKDHVKFIPLSSLTSAYAVVGGTGSISHERVSAPYRSDIADIINMNYRQQLAVVINSLLYICIPTISFSINRNLFITTTTFDIANAISCIVGMAGCNSKIKKYPHKRSDKPPFTVYISPMGDDSVFNRMLMEQYASPEYQHFLKGRLINQMEHSAVVGNDIHPVETFYKHCNIQGTYRTLQEIAPECWDIPLAVRELTKDNYVISGPAERSKVTPLMYSEVVSSVETCKDELFCLEVDHPKVFMGNGFLLRHP